MERKIWNGVIHQLKVDINATINILKEGLKNIGRDCRLH